MKTVVNAVTGKAESIPLSASENAQRAADAAQWATQQALPARRARVQNALDALFASDDAETQLLAAIVKQIAIDVAGLKNVTPAQYKAEILAAIEP